MLEAVHGVPLSQASRAELKRLMQIKSLTPEERIAVADAFYKAFRRSLGIFLRDWTDLHPSRALNALAEDGNDIHAFVRGCYE
jgi:hypothetical protein